MFGCYQKGVTFDSTNQRKLKTSIMKNETNTQHTPAPWTVFSLEKPESNLIATIRCENQNLAIAKILWASTSDRTREEAEANAQLIARAPELLKENEQLKEDNKKLLHEHGQLSDQVSLCGADNFHLQALNAELLEALKWTIMFVGDLRYQSQHAKKEEVCKLISKAEGKTLSVS